MPCRGVSDILTRLFEPLGYVVRAEHHPLDEKFPEWGESNNYSIELEQEIALQALLTHLYVLVPVLDAEKHYEALARLMGDEDAEPEQEQEARAAEE